VDKQRAAASVADRAAGYGMPGQQVDGTDPVAVFRVVSAGAARARRGDGPTLIESRVVRLAPHSTDDDEARYRPPDERARSERRDPLPCFARRLGDWGLLDRAAEAGRWDGARRRVEAALAFAEAAPEPTPESALDHLYAMPRGTPQPGARPRCLLEAEPGRQGQRR
jgi:2-oxoisovalerate dehydrogenase E1 component alpha subunit